MVGTLGVAGYLDAVENVRKLAQAAGKKTYTLLMGKPTPAKLANFPEVEVFVLVADPQVVFVSACTCSNNSFQDFPQCSAGCLREGWAFHLACIKHLPRLASTRMSYNATRQYCAIMAASPSSIEWAAEIELLSMLNPAGPDPGQQGVLRRPSSRPTKHSWPSLLAPSGMAHTAWTLTPCC